jgi:hypothetical protein
MEIEKISDFGVGDIVQHYYSCNRGLEGLRKVVYTHIDLCCGHPMIDLSSSRENEFINSKRQCAGGWKPVVKHLSKRIAIWVIRNEI